MRELITRADAIEQGITTYFTGVPCLRGHITNRKVGNGNCVECSRLLTKRWRDDGKKQEMMKAKVMPSVEYLSQCFHIKDNVLCWSIRPLDHFDTLRGYKVHLAKFANKPAGHVNKRHCYIEVRLDGLLHKAHRLIYKMFYEIEPEFMVDHIDGNVSNNSHLNLREANSIENARNASKRSRKGISEHKGVLYSKGSWYSTITVRDESVLVLAMSEEAAAQDYDRRATEVFGEFAKLNFVET
jgi:hypothetical protein